MTTGPSSPACFCTADGRTSSAICGRCGSSGTTSKTAWARCASRFSICRAASPPAWFTCSSTPCPPFPPSVPAAPLPASWAPAFSCSPARASSCSCLSSFCPCFSRRQPTVEHRPEPWRFPRENGKGQKSGTRPPSGNPPVLEEPRDGVQVRRHAHGTVGEGWRNFSS